MTQPELNLLVIGLEQLEQQDAPAAKRPKIATSEHSQHVEQTRAQNALVRSKYAEIHLRRDRWLFTQRCIITFSHSFILT